MTKTLVKAIVALTIGGAALLPAAPASADSAGAAVAAGIGGFALGAIAGGAARPAPYYGPVYAAPVYDAPPPVHCWRERRPLFDEYGEVVGYRPQRVCQ